MQREIRLAGALFISSILALDCAHGLDPERPAGETGSGGSTGTGLGGSTTSGSAGSSTESPTSTSSSTGASGGSTSSTGGAGGSTTASTSSTGGSGGATTSSTGGSGGATTSSTSSAGGSGGAGGGVVGAFPGCLQNPPASCPYCATQNQSDKPKCEEYVNCYIDNLCKPTDPCGQLDAVCGVNTIGGGNAPRDAAIATYMCACN